MQMLRPYRLLLLVIPLTLCCRKENQLTTSASARLSFSADSIIFDTVFTSIGSVTKQLKVYNPNKNAVKISQIRLNGGSASSYQLNINGNATTSLHDVEVRGKDSLNIFVKVLINPNGSHTPFLTSDFISFLTNGNLQSVQLSAYGQNAHFLKDEVIKQNTVWDNKLPYIIYNTLRINNNQLLTITKGTRIYFHKDSKMIIDGTLIVDGTRTENVTFSSDRLERLYADEPGQWVGLHFTGSSSNSKITHAEIKNASVGIQVDSLSNSTNPKLLLTNSTLKNMQITALSGVKASIAAFNNLFYTCGQYLLYAVNGGDYDIKQNTFVNLNFGLVRQTPCVLFSDNLPGENTTALLKLSFVNNIVWGNLSDELVLEKKGSADINAFLQTNLLKTKNNAFSGSNIINSDPLFVNAQKDNYRPGTGSPALTKGFNLTGDFYYNSILKSDKEGKVRFYPSVLGCYEF